MKNLALLLSGAGLASLALLATSARGPEPSQEPMHLRGGATVFGLNLVQGTSNPLAGLSQTSAVSIRAVSGEWLQIDSPGLKAGPTWIHKDNIVSYRTGR